MMFQVKQYCTYPYCIGNQIIFENFFDLGSVLNLIILLDTLEYKIYETLLSNMGHITKSIGLILGLDCGQITLSKNSQKCLFHQFCVKLTMCGSAILSKDIATSRCGRQPFPAKLFYSLSILFQWKPKVQFHTIRSNSSLFLSLEMCSDTFWNVFWWCNMNPTILIVDQCSH